MLMVLFLGWRYKGEGYILRVKWAYATVCHGTTDLSIRSGKIQKSTYDLRSARFALEPYRIQSKAGK